MKNLMSFFALTTLLFFASCSKEALIQPETAAAIEIETVNSMVQKSDTSMPLESPSHARDNGINVTVSSQSSDGVELIVNFASSHNFTDSNLESTQNIDFTNGNGNTITLTFGVNSYSGGNGTLTVNFTIGGNDLTGLEMKTAQIVIEDTLII